MLALMIETLIRCDCDSGATKADALVGIVLRLAKLERPVDSPSAQGAVTYTADSRFHFITVRTEVPKYASADPARPSPEEAMAVASGVVAISSERPISVGSSRRLPTMN